MTEPGKPFYEFGSFRLDPAERLLRHDGKLAALTPKMFDILLYLVERNGQLVSKDELMRAVWPDTFVEDANLTVNISSLRKALGDPGAERQYIETVQRRGYRFGVEVKKCGIAEAKIDDIKAPVEEPIRRSRYGEVQRYAIRLLVALGIVAAVIFVVGINKFGAARWRSLEPSFHSMKIARLTSTGKVAEAIISPDGKYMAYVFDDGGKRSVRVKQVGAESDLEIVAPRNLGVGGLTFSRDGNFIYFMKEEREMSLSALYRLPVLGGVEKKIINQRGVVEGRPMGIASQITFSPDGAQMAFLRNNSGPKESMLEVANSDGSNERTLAIRRWPEVFAGPPAWSPDATTIVCQTSSNDNRYNRGLVAISVADGKTREIDSRRWFPGQFSWLPDGAGLIFSAVEDTPDSPSSNSQIWSLSFPGGEARRITNDLSNYGTVSLTADARGLVTVQSERLSNLWLIPRGNANRAKQISFSAGKREGLVGLATLPDGRIVYDLDVGVAGQRNIMVMSPDGGNPKQLTTNAQGRANTGQSVSPDGRFIIYNSVTDRPHVWRMDSDGGNSRQLTFGGAEVGQQISADGRWIVYVSMNEGRQTIWKMSINGDDARQLTFGGGEIDPQISPDGKWVVYSAVNVGESTIWKVPFDGGAPIQLTDKVSARPKISPDGKTILCFYWEEWPNKVPKVALIPISGVLSGLSNGSNGLKGSVKALDLDIRYQRDIRWAPDGRALTYIEHRGGVSNLWMLPLNGVAPQQLTDFKSDRIYNYAWSRDGENLFCVRGIEMRDAVMISGFR